MEKTPARPRAEKPKLVPLKDDIDACLNVLSREQSSLLRTNSHLTERATSVLNPLSRIEKSEYAQKVGEGRLAPLTHDAMEENERRMDDLEELKNDLHDGLKAISERELPNVAFLKALREAWHVDRMQTDGDLRRLHVLRRMHAEGTPLGEKEYEELNRLPARLAVAKERLKRLRDRLHMLEGVRRQEEVHLGFTQEGDLTQEGEPMHRERLDAEIERLMKKPANLPRVDRGEEPDHREFKATTSTNRKAA